MAINYLLMKDIPLAGKRVLIREDFNVPMQDGHIVDNTRLKAAIPTIEAAIHAGAAVILMSHFGRPKKPEFDARFSLAPVAKALSELLGKSVRFISDWSDGVSVSVGEVVLCENVRFLPGEKSCDEMLSKKIAALCDVFVMDAFASAHRAHASTVGVAKFAPAACAGPLLNAELSALHGVFDAAKKPIVAIVGGAKVSTKITVLESLLDHVDTLIVGGGIANTFLVASGYDVGNSLVEKDWVPSAQLLLKKAKEKGVALPLPTDVAVGRAFSADENAVVKSVDSIESNDMVLDVGPVTSATYQSLLAHAGTIIWNGPVGVFEFEHFAAGTRALGEAIASSDAVSVAGGGDTVAAINTFNFSAGIDVVSTGGGAFLEWLIGELPAVKVLEDRLYAKSST